jgi:hypothetical protein
MYIVPIPQIAEWVAHSPTDYQDKTALTLREDARPLESMALDG